MFRSIKKSLTCIFWIKLTTHTCIDDGILYFPQPNCLRETVLANIALRVDKFSDSAVNGLNCVWLVLSGSCHLRLPFLGERLCVMAVPSSKTVDAANSNFLRAYKHYSTSSGIWRHIQATCTGERYCASTCHRHILYNLFHTDLWVCVRAGR